MKEKYGDQDEEERQLRMEILAVRSCLLTLTMYMCIKYMFFKQASESCFAYPTNSL